MMKRKAFTLIELSIVILIIGIVISAVIAANLLISKARIATARNLTQTSPIALIKDASFWLESTMLTSFEQSEAEDGLDLSIWRDNIGAGNNATASGGNSPTYANTINRIHAVKFNGSNQFFSVNGSSLNNSDYTIMVVEKRLSDKSDNYFIGDPSVTTANQNLILGYSLDGALIHSQGGSNSYIANVETYSDSKDKPRIFIFTSSATGKRTYINGMLVASSNDTTKLSNITNLAIGKGYDGEIAEVIAFSRALTPNEIDDSQTYLSKKYAEKKFSGSCIGGVATSSGSCSCLSGYVLNSEGTACIATSSITCSIAATSSLAAKTNLPYATSATAISSPCQSGYNGSPTYTCTTAGAANVSGSCTPNTCSVAVTGSATASITQGGGNITCGQTGYTGTFTNNCSTNGGTVSGVCGCDTAGGYVLNSGGTACVLSSSITCNVAAANGFAAKTSLPYAASAAILTSPCQAGYAASTPAPTYTCTVSGSTVTPTGSCVISTCSVSIAGSNTTSVSAGSGSITCTQTGYTGTVNYTCTSGVFTPSRAMCACASKYRESSGACVAGVWTNEASNSARSFRWNYSGAITAGTQFSGSTATCDKAHDGLLVYAGSSKSTSGITMNSVSGWANCFCYTTAGCTGCSGSTHWGGAVSSSSPQYVYKCNYP